MDGEVIWAKLVFYIHSYFAHPLPHGFVNDTIDLRLSWEQCPVTKKWILARMLKICVQLVFWYVDFLQAEGESGTEL